MNRRTLATSLVGLVDGLDNTDSDGLTHVTDSETTEWWVGVVLLNTHRLGGNKLGNAGITRLYELGRRLDRLAGTTVDLLDELGELASNMGSVAVENRGVASTNLTGVVEDDDLGVEGSSFLGGVVLGVGSDVTTADILDGDVLNVETNVVTGDTLLKLLVVHLNGLDFGGHTDWSEGDNHTSLDNTSLDTTDGHRADTTNLVDILEGETKGLVRRTNGRLDGIDSIEESLALDDTSLGLLSPTLVPGHAESKIDQHQQTTFKYP
jgi:hypothetical protein